MHEITRPVVKKDHAEKANGSACYVGDYPTKGMLHGAMVRSSVAHALITDIAYPPLPPGYFVVDCHDVTGKNSFHSFPDQSSVFVASEVRFVGDHIAMIVGPDARQAYELAAATVVGYQELPAVLDLEESESFFYQCSYDRGDVDEAFAQADKIYTERFHTGYQEQGYLETQGMIACFDGDTMTVHGSMQCPFYVHASVVLSTGLADDKVRVIQDVTGGGFGGKEAYPSILAAQASVAALKAGGKPVRVVFNRREDMEFSSKRNPSRTDIRLALKDGRVTALDIDVRFKAGAAFLPSLAVIQRCLIAVPGAYCIPNLKVKGAACETNTVPSGAFRGFGAPQGFFAIETMMSHVAKDLGIEPLEFKRLHLVVQGDLTSSSGRFHFPVPLPAMLEKLEAASDYRHKRKRYAAPQAGRLRRGIGSAVWFHGAGFTGQAERDLIKGVVALHKSADGRVEVLASSAEIGQGTKTTFCKIVARELGLPYEQVLIRNPDTARVPNSGPTAASRSLMIVGELLRRAAVRLRSEWAEGQEQHVEEQFCQPDFMIPFDPVAFYGDANPTYAWGAAAVEVELDTFTGTNRVVGCWTVFDVGTPVDENIVLGQMAGGVLQGLGYASMEQMPSSAQGRVLNRSYSDYLLPTACDVGQIDIQLHVEEYPFGPYGGKGAGELPLVGMAPAFLAAIEQCLGEANQSHIPFSAEDALAALGTAPVGGHQ
jgi:CO/xanthine dehydrogenase Mo-binding subunit